MRENLTPQQEAFCLAYIETGSPAAAYRRVYAINGTMATIAVNASHLMSHPVIAARIRELRDIAAAGALLRAVDLLAHDAEIMLADPNELVSVQVESCRNCHGIDHRYQWVDDGEYARACDAALTMPMVKGQTEPHMPDMAGGFGFDPRQEPALDCPHCFGKGIKHVDVKDTTKLSPAARKLYKGAKQDRWGQIEVLMHDQAAAKDRLYRALGVYKDGAAVPGVVLPNADPISKEASDEQAARSYLQMIQK